MKAFFFSLILMACSNLLMAQQDKIYFYYGKYGYKDVAQGRFMDLYSKEKSSKVPVFSTTMVSDKYKEEDLDLISIPILEWNHQSYRCGDNLESLVAFKQDFLFQKVFIVTKEGHLKVGTFEIFDSYNEENRKKDSINNVKYSLHGRPVMSDNEKMEKKIYKYCWENPNVFVFMIRGLHGYWGVIDGKLVKLIVKGREIIGEVGSEFVCKNYGEQFINDAIVDCLKTGYGYAVCPDCKVNSPINIDIKIASSCKKLYKEEIRLNENLDVTKWYDLEKGIPFPHRHDGATFYNNKDILPLKPSGYYREDVVPTPGIKGAGVQRIVIGNGGEWYYTPDHYKTFIQFKP